MYNCSILCYSRGARCAFRCRTCCGISEPGGVSFFGTSALLIVLPTESSAACSLPHTHLLSCPQHLAPPRSAMGPVATPGTADAGEPDKSHRNCNKHLFSALPSSVLTRVELKGLPHLQARMAKQSQQSAVAGLQQKSFSTLGPWFSSRLAKGCLVFGDPRNRETRRLRSS